MTLKFSFLLVICFACVTVFGTCPPNGGGVSYIYKTCTPEDKRTFPPCDTDADCKEFGAHFCCYESNKCGKICINYTYRGGK